MPPPDIRFEVSASLRVTSDTVIHIDTKAVTIETSGPSGGRRDPVIIPIDKWNAINEAVTSVRDALHAAEAAAQQRLLPESTGSSP